MDVIKEAIILALKPVEGDPEIWLNPKKGILSRFVTEGQELRKKIILNYGEQPIFEYSLVDCYSLITSQRVISFRRGVFYEMALIEIYDSRPLIPKNEYAHIRPWSMFWVKDINDNKFLVEFDPGNPTYFALMLVKHLSSMVKRGTW